MIASCTLTEKRVRTLRRQREGTNRRQVKRIGRQRSLKMLSLTRNNKLSRIGMKRTKKMMSTSMTGMVSIERGKIRKTSRMGMTTMMSLGVV